MPYSLLISLTDLPRSLSSNIYRLNSFVYRFCFKTIFPVLLYNLSYFYPYLLSQILYQIQFSMNALGKRKGTRYISSLFLSVSMCYSVQQIGICCSVKLKVSSVIDFPQISLHQSSKFLAF